MFTALCSARNKQSERPQVSPSVVVLPLVPCELRGSQLGADKVGRPPNLACRIHSPYAGYIQVKSYGLSMVRFDAQGNNWCHVGAGLKWRKLFTF